MKENFSIVADVVKMHRKNLRDAGFFHRYSVDRLCRRRRFFRVRNDQKLRLGNEVKDCVGESMDVRFVERRVDFVQNAYRALMSLENRQKERDAGQRFFAAAHERKTAQFLSRRTRDDFNASFQGIGRVFEG